MKIEEKFNKRTAGLIAVQNPSVHVGAHLALGIKIEFFPESEAGDSRTLRMHMTRDEALHLARDLLSAVIRSV